MAILINKESGLAEDAPEQSLTQGTHGIPLLDEQGNPVTADSVEDAQRLVQNYGHKQLGPEASAELLKKAKYSSTGETIKAGAEAVGRGVAGPLATLAETKLLGVKPEDIRGREEANPNAAMAGELAGLVGGGLTGAGEGAALGLVGEAAAKRVAEHVGEGFAGKLASKAVAGAVENAAYQSGVEAHRMIAEDPDATASAAISHMGLAAVLGGAVGGGLGAASMAGSALLDSKLAGKAGQFLSDARSKLTELADNPDPVHSLTEELSQVHNRLKDTGEAYGLKAQEMAKLVPRDEASIQRITAQTSDLQTKLTETIDKLRSKNGMDAVADKIEQDLAEFNQAASASPAETFKAINKLKRKFDKYEFGYQQEFTPGANFRPMAHQVRRELVDALENKEVWGQAAERHAAFNKAYTKFDKPLEEFERTFGTTLNDEKVVDPGKIATYLRQLGKPNAEIKQERLANFLNSLEGFKAELKKTHENLGLSTEELDALHTPHARRSLEDQTAGTRFAEWFAKQGMGKAAGAIMGGVTGATFGHPYAGAILGEKLFGSEFNKVLPAIIKPLVAKDANPSAMKATISYAAAAMKGETALNRGIKSVFAGGRDVVSSPETSDIEKLKKRLDKIAKNPQEMLNTGASIGHYMPEHSTSVALGASRAVQYLQSLKPQEAPLGPLDMDSKANKVANARYESALEIAQAPLTVLPKIGNATLTETNIKDLNALYPGLMPKMQQKLLAGLVDHKHAGKTVPYKTQLGMSMFLGQPLSSSMNPQNIMAAQIGMHSAKSNTMQPAAPRAPHSMSGIAKAPKQLLTTQSAIASRRSNR